jgi:hypothetical protein
MPTPSRFPSALGRQHGGDIDLDTPRRREASAAQIARMTSAQYKAFAESKGIWVEADQEALADMRNRDPSGLRRW